MGGALDTQQKTGGAQWDQAGSHLRAPGPKDDKYSRGTVLLATGSPTYPGAAVLGVLGAARYGGGMVRYLGPDKCSDLVLGRVPEAVLGGGKFDAAVIGSGWDGSMATAADLVARQSAKESKPLVVDAGALHGVAEWVRAGAQVVATPHPGEAASIFAQLEPASSASRAEIEADPEVFALRLAELSGAVVVLKSYRTAVASPKGELHVFTPPSSWGATPGAGDVLAGAIGAALAGDSEDVTSTVFSAVVVHGLAAQLACGVVAEDLELTGFAGGPILATDIAAHLGDAVGALLRPAKTGSKKELQNR